MLSVVDCPTGCAFCKIEDGNVKAEVKWKPQSLNQNIQTKPSTNVNEELSQENNYQLKDTEQEKSVDFQLLRNIAFDMFCLGCIIGYLGYNADFLYLPAIASHIGSSKQEGALLISILSKNSL